MQLSHCSHQKLPETGPAGAFGCICSLLLPTAGSALAPRAWLDCLAQGMSTRSSFTQDTAPRPLSSAATFSVPAAGSSHGLHSGTVAQGFVTSGMAGMEGKGSQGADAAALKPFWLQEAPLPSHPWGQQGSWGHLPSGRMHFLPLSVTRKQLQILCTCAEKLVPVLGFCQPQEFASTSQRHLPVSCLLNPWLAFPCSTKFSSGAMDRWVLPHHCQLRDTTLPSPVGGFQHQDFRQIEPNFAWANARHGSSARAAPTWNITFHTLLLQSIQKKNKMKWKSALLLLLLLLTFRLRNKTTGFAQGKFAFWQRPGLKNSASNAKMPESYEYRNENFL